MSKSRSNEALLSEAFSIVDDHNNDMDAVVSALRDLLSVDHLVYHSSKLGTSPSVDPYIRLTYPADWIKRYLQMGYVDVDPVLREGFLRTRPFEWNELTISTEREGEFLADALAHGVGPYGLSIPVIGKRGHRGLFTVSSSGSESDWVDFRETHFSALIEIANKVHRRVIAEVFGEDHLHLTDRELECLRWTALGKDTGDIASILEISVHTTRDYLKSARHKLDCVTSAQAVSKAVKMGLLKL